MSPTSGSDPVTVPISAPAAFSATVEPVRTGWVGVSFTLSTAITTTLERLPSMVVAVITSVTEASASRSRLIPSFSFRVGTPSTSTISKRASSTARDTSTPGSTGSVNRTGPITPPGVFSETMPSGRAGTGGVASGSTVSTTVCVEARPSPSVAVITRLTVGSSPTDRLSPAFSFSMSPTISNRLSSTLKVRRPSCVVASSGSVAVTRPTIAPASPPWTVSEDSTGVVGASLTSVTVTSITRSAESPPVSVAVITSATEPAAS